MKLLKMLCETSTQTLTFTVSSPDQKIRTKKTDFLQKYIAQLLTYKVGNAEKFTVEPRKEIPRSSHQIYVLFCVFISLFKTVHYFFGLIWLLCLRVYQPSLVILCQSHPCRITTVILFNPKLERIREFVIAPPEFELAFSVAAVQHFSYLRQGDSASRFFWSKKYLQSTIPMRPFF